MLITFGRVHGTYHENQLKPRHSGCELGGVGSENLGGGPGGGAERADGGGDLVEGWGVRVWG